jgi:hypothetical protein
MRAGAVVRKGLLLALGLMVALVPLRADWKITTVETYSGRMETVRTEYYKDKLRRTDMEVNGAPGLVAVVDLTAERQTMWDVKRKEYVRISLKQRPTQAALAEADPATRPVLLVATSTMDTGERQTIFGRTARHLITSEKRSREEVPGAETKFNSEMLTDGWYLDASGLPMERHSYMAAMLIGSSGAMPVIRTSHTGPVPSGLVVRQKVTRRFSEGLDRQFETSMEVTGLYEGALSQHLFEPPADFRRVDKLADTAFAIYKPSFSDEIEMYWNSFENWLLSWFS